MADLLHDEKENPMSKVTAQGLWEVLKNAFAGFNKNKVPKLSASLAYYTIFSMGPMLLVIIFLADLFWGREAVEGSIYGQIKGLVGNGAASQIQEILKNADVSGNNTMTAIIGFVTLLIGATTVFADMQDSINTIWNLKVKAKNSWLKLIVDRLLSFSVVISLGFLLLVSLVLNSILEGLMNKLQSMFPDMAVFAVYGINLLLTISITGFLFAIIFKVLPDAQIKWRDVAVGAFFTTVLFLIGKFGITIYIGTSDVGSTYGAAGSLVVLVLWVYFTAMILYFGAEFTKAYAMKYGTEIRPSDFSVTVQTVQVESKKQTLQENEADTEQTEADLQIAKDEIDGKKK